jgi:hypothetical protein
MTLQNPARHREGTLISFALLAGYDDWQGEVLSDQNGL